MKIMLQIFWLILISGCSTSQNLANSDQQSPNSLIYTDPHIYTIKNPDGTESKVKSHFISDLSSEEFDALKTYLNNISESKINFNNHIIINFIDNDPKIHIDHYQVPWDIFYGDMKKDLAKLGKPNHFWMINPRVKDLNYYHANKIQWFVDKDDVIRELFFEYNGLNGGFVIIRPTGKYFVNVGEYRKSEVLEAYKEFK